MKILRIRRGYTTNSSGGNEWVPPKDGTYNQAKTGEAGANAVKIPAEQQAALNATSAKQVTILATQPRVAEQQASPAVPKGGKSSTNLGLMGILFGAICALFVVTGSIKWFLKKKK